METKRDVTVDSPLSDILIDNQRLIVQYSGTAFSALVPFLPQTYFSGWDIVICLRDIMREDEKRLEEYLDSFSRIWVTAIEGGKFMIREGSGANGHSRFLLTGLGYVAEMCVLLLSTYMPYPHILSFLIERRNVNNTLRISVPGELNEDMLHRTDWADAVRTALTPYMGEGHGGYSPNMIVQDILLRNPEDIDREHYRKYADVLALLNGDYRQYFSIYNEEENWLSVASIIPQEPYAPTILRETGITLTDEQIPLVFNTYLLNVRRMDTDLDYLIRILQSSLQNTEGDDRGNRALYGPYQWNDSVSDPCRDLIMKCFTHHMERGERPTEGQSRAMESLLPINGIDPSMIVDLYIFFRIDFGRRIVDNLGRHDINNDWESMHKWRSHISLCMKALDASHGKGKQWVPLFARKEEKHIRKRKLAPCGIRIAHAPSSLWRKKIYRGKEYKVREGSWVEISPCERFVSSLLECCIHPGIVEILHGCQEFVDYVTERYRSFSSFTVEETRTLVSQICQNNLCHCHHDARKVNPKACRTPLFITSEFGCVLECCRISQRMERYRRKGETPTDMMIDLQSAHLLDHIHGKIFDMEADLFHRNIIALFPKEGAPVCRERDIRIEEIDFGIYRTEEVDTRTMKYGKTLDQGRFVGNPCLVRAIRRAARNAERYRNVAPDAINVLRKMVPSEAGKWRWRAKWGSSDEEEGDIRGGEEMADTDAVVEEE